MASTTGEGEDEMRSSPLAPPTTTGEPLSSEPTPAPTLSPTSTPAEPAEPAPPPSPAPIPMPQVHLTFLLISGTRKNMSFDPQTAVGRVKELVWNAWPSDWSDERPPAPSYLRILYLGKLLQDEDTLAKLGFPIDAPTSTIVHISVRIIAPPDANDGGGKKRKKAFGGSGGGGSHEGAGCCSGCVIC